MNTTENFVQTLIDKLRVLDGWEISPNKFPEIEAGDILMKSGNVNLFLTNENDSLGVINCTAPAVYIGTNKVKSLSVSEYEDISQAATELYITHVHRIDSELFRKAKFN